MVGLKSLAIFILFSSTVGLLAVEERSHNHGPAWSDHCWDNAPNHLMDPFCAFQTDISCTTPPEVDHATHTTQGDYKTGATLTYSCEETYELTGNDTIVCVADKESKTAVWTTPPTCVELTCTDAPQIDNGQPLPYNTTSIGDIVQYICNDTYAFSSGYNYVSCQNDTTWSQSPTCGKVCSDPPSISHGGYSPKTGPLVSGTEITYYCDKRYVIVGNETVVCTGEGIWEYIPDCRQRFWKVKPFNIEAVLPVGECPTGELDILFIVDGSGSVGRDDFDRTLWLVNDYVSLYQNSGIRFALISFSSMVVNEFNLNTYVNDPDALALAINQTSYTAGGTNTAAALEYARTNSFTAVNGKRDNAEQIAIIITDGFADNATAAEIEAKLLRDANVTIYAIGIGLPDTSELDRIAGDDNVYIGQTYLSISQIAKDIQRDICEGKCPAVPEIPNGQVIGPSSTKVDAIVRYKCDAGFTFESVDYVACNENNKWSPLPKCIPVFKCDEPPEIANGYHGVPGSYQQGGTVKYSCNLDSPYVLFGNDTAVCDDDNGTLTWMNVPSCECEKSFDVIFIIDGSGSVTTNGFMETLDFVNDMIDQYSADTTRFGLLVFSSNVNLQFNLDDYVNDVLTMKEKVSNTSYPTGNTHTYDALTYARTDMFQERNGMRTNASQIAIVVTDGKSADPNKTADEAQKLKDAGVAIYSVGVGSSVDDVELTSMASSPNLVFHVNDYANISTVTGPLSTSTCNVICQDPPSVNNGYITSGVDTSLGAMVSYACNDSYWFESYSTVTCLASGQWTKTPECILMECSAPPTIDNGYALNENDTFLGAHVNYTCDDNYVFTSNYDVVCLPTGNWTDAPDCRPRECGPVPTVLHSVLSPKLNSTFVGADIYYTCETNYRLVGQETVTCQDNEQWSATPKCECQAAPLDIVFIADTSGSIGLSGFLTTVDFITLMTEVYPKDTTRFGLITFSSNASVEFYLNTFINNKTGLREAIKDAEFSAGGTDTYEAFQLANSDVFDVSNGMRENVTHIAVVVTDGQSNNGNLTLTEAQALKDNGVIIYSVGVGDFDTVELKAMASDDAYVFNVKTFGDLSSVAGPLTELMCFVNYLTILGAKYVPDGTRRALSTVLSNDMTTKYNLKRKYAIEKLKMCAAVQKAVLKSCKCYACEVEKECRELLRTASDRD